MPLRSDLLCEICRVSIHDCRCLDVDERLRRIAYEPGGFVMFRWCRACDKHFARCRCAVFDDYVICGGQEVDIFTVRTISGRPPEIDLLHR